MRRRCKLYLFRAALIISLCGVTVVYCLRNAHSQTALLCAQQEVGYSRGETSGTFSLTADEGNHLKYSQLLQDILRSYQHYHGVRKKELAAGNTSKTLTWYCIKGAGCNGIGDRVIGMCVAFLLAVVTNRTFFIHQSGAVQSTMFLEPSAIDWRPIHNCVELRHDQMLAHFGRPSNFQKNWLMVTMNFSLELNRLSDFDSIYISDKEEFYETIMSIRHSVIYDNLSPLHRRLLQSILESGAGESLHSFGTVLHQYLFRLPQRVQQMGLMKLNELKLQPRRFVTVHIRTGFKNSMFGEILLTEEFFKGERFVRRKDSWRNMIDCAIRISDSRFGRKSTILVASDDREPKIWAASEYKSRVTMLDIDPVHVANKPILGVFRSKSKDVYLDTWVELSVMSQSSAIVGIYSGFAEVASHAGSLDPRSVYIYNISQETCTHLT
ncbi:hypothetical protein GBAR_LOCUS4547 [Geodia barretti]|uniref:Fucosyltransferase n=1 Tax=Geodia barretti TaxID=519541 RepID=A0AA35R777_GEOBA|nr:hypothetical protein GBAR_LOCUS4547 [Geodia barretti]